MAKKKTFVTLDDKNTLLETADETVENDAEIIEEIKVDNIKTCKITKILPNNKAMISFEKFGLIVNLTDTTKKTVDVKFEGEIGKPDFKYEVM